MATPASPPAAPVLRTCALERRYGNRIALGPTDFELRAGELVALVGPNGAGKSTLLSLLAGALPPSGGRVELPDPHPSVGWAPQRPALYGHLTARENVELFARLAGLTDPGAAADRALGEIDLAATTQRASQLSVGNQQRLNLALALLGDPDLLLLDEPTASLDTDRQRLVWKLLLARRDGGKTALLATHTTEEAAGLATRVVTLVEGTIVADEAIT